MGDTDNLYGQEYYEAHESSFRCEQREDHARILRLLDLTGTERVLEIGCGLGVLLDQIPVEDKVGIEVNDFAVKECTKRGLAVVRADAEERLPFDNSSFDVIIMNSVIEHLRNPEFAVRECFRVLVPQGRLILTTPARSLFVRNTCPTHLSELSVGELGLLLQKSGFKVVAHEVCGLSFLYPLLENFVYRPARFLRGALARGGRGVESLESVRGVVERSPFWFLNRYRRNFLWLGTSQLVLAQKRRFNDWPKSS